MRNKPDERFSVQEFRDLEHALHVLTALTQHARSREVAHELLISEGERAKNTLRRLPGFSV